MVPREYYSGHKTAAQARITSWSRRLSHALIEAIHEIGDPEEAAKVSAN